MFSLALPKHQRCNEWHTYLVMVVSWFHGGACHLVHHGCVAKQDGQERKKVHHQEVIKNEGSLVENGRERLAAVLLWTKPIAFGQLVV